MEDQKEKEGAVAVLNLGLGVAKEALEQKDRVEFTEQSE